MELSTFYPWINFIIFLGLLFYFLRAPLKLFLRTRQEMLQKDLEIVRREKVFIEKAFQDLKKKFSESDIEMEQLKSDLKQVGESEKAILIEKAKVFAQRIRDDASRVGTQELQRVKVLLHKKTLKLAIDLARKNVEKAMQTEDQDRLLRQGLQHLENLNHEGTDTR